MDMPVKICGLSTPESVSAARDGGATHLGFIFFPKSPRNVTPKEAAVLSREKDDALSVAVTVDAGDDFLDTIVEEMRPDMLQLHGSETLQRIAEIKDRYELPIIKALAIREEEDLAKVRLYENAVDLLLLDAKPPKDADLPGGNGVSFDWSVLNGLKSETPVLLSGGIDIENLDDALDHVRDATNSVIGLDVSSGVESAPGVKDIAKIETFLSVCRSSTDGS